MGCKVNHSINSLALFKVSTKRANLCPRKIITFSSSPNSQIQQTQEIKTDHYTVNFKTLGACKLGIAKYPDFGYNAEGGKGTGSASRKAEETTSDDDELLVSFDLNTLYIPPLTSSTTKFLGLPLPPFLKISIDPQHFKGTINQNSGQVDLEFKAKFWFTIGSLYKAPALIVETVLTSEESLVGKMRSGRGERLDKDGKCRLVGVATVDPIDDFLMNSFLGLPTECLADLNAIISFTPSAY